MHLSDDGDLVLDDGQVIPSTNLIEAYRLWGERTACEPTASLSFATKMHRTQAVHAAAGVRQAIEHFLINLAAYRAALAKDRGRSTTAAIVPLLAGAEPSEPSCAFPLFLLLVLACGALAFIAGRRAARTDKPRSMREEHADEEWWA